ncbi:molecular chaperone [Photobacterium damselae]|uniref:molecular chaperone n=2 Tax=Photobacterium damselae TaxID=38293 RepID=UPI00124B3130|nr:molecular chaperone [Photobacterium damselae]KAB1506981.1 molecular chaperone [Photobacterium damselae subsp. damselae]
MDRISKIINIALIVFIGMSQYAYAFKVQPMVSELAPIGSDSQLVMRVDNVDKKPLTIEVIPFELKIDSQGQETLVPADDEFLAVPVTAVIQPGRSQSVMVKYVGDPSIVQSKAYRISFRQVPIQLSEQEKGQLGLSVHINTLVNVAPKNSRSKLVVSNIQSQGTSWKMTLTNNGNKYARLSETNWKVIDVQGNPYNLNKKSVAQLSDKNIILPKSSLEITLPKKNEFKSKPKSVEINTEQ